MPFYFVRLKDQVKEDTFRPPLTRRVTSLRSNGLGLSKQSTIRLQTTDTPDKSGRPTRQPTLTRKQSTVNKKDWRKPHKKQTTIRALRMVMSYQERLVYSNISLEYVNGVLMDLMIYIYIYIYIYVYIYGVLMNIFSDWTKWTWKIGYLTPTLDGHAQKLPVFLYKLTTKPLITNLRHGSLHMNVFDPC